MVRAYRKDWKTYSIRKIQYIEYIDFFQHIGFFPYAYRIFLNKLKRIIVLSMNSFLKSLQFFNSVSCFLHLAICFINLIEQIQSYK